LGLKVRLNGKEKRKGKTQVLKINRHQIGNVDFRQLGLTSEHGTGSKKGHGRNNCAESNFSRRKKEVN